MASPVKHTQVPELTTPIAISPDASSNATTEAAAALADASIAPATVTPAQNPIASEENQQGLIGAYWGDARGADADKPLKDQTVGWVLCKLHGFDNEEALSDALMAIAHNKGFEQNAFKITMVEALAKSCDPSAASQIILKVKEEDGAVKNWLLATYSPKKIGDNPEKGWMFQAANGSMGEESIRACKNRELIEELAANNIDGPVMNALLNTQGVKIGGKLADLNAVASAINSDNTGSLYYNVATLSGNTEVIARADVDAFMEQINTRIGENNKFYQPVCGLIDWKNRCVNPDKLEEAKNLISDFLNNEVCQKTILPQQWSFCFNAFKANPEAADAELLKKCVFELVEITETSEVMLTSADKYKAIVEQHQVAYVAKLGGDKSLMKKFETTGLEGKPGFDAGFPIAYPALELEQDAENDFLELCAQQYIPLPASSS